MGLEEGGGWARGIIFVPDEKDMLEAQAELFLHKEKCFAFGRGRFAGAQLPRGLL